MQPYFVCAMAGCSEILDEFERVAHLIKRFNKYIPEAEEIYISPDH
jgi:hypothetical protein